MGQTPSERMAALVLDEEGFESIDPAHPLGGKDGGVDARVRKDGEPWVMAVYFPRGQQSIKDITEKLTSDVGKAQSTEPKPVGVAFVTNQELRLSEREVLRGAGGDTKIELYHLERIATILDRPHMAGVREQFLGIPAGPPPILVTAEVIGAARHFSRSEELFEAVVEIEKKSRRDRNEQLLSSPPDLVKFQQDARLMRSMGYESSDEPPQPVSNYEIDQQMDAFSRELKGRWNGCQDYLASITWPALQFRVANCAQSFLTNVQVILTFRGAVGLEFANHEKFEWERLKDPNWDPPARGPCDIITSAQRYSWPRPAGYPVSWDHNDDGDLEVTITLAELRPHPPWRHVGNDVVLVMRDTRVDEMTVTALTEIPH